MRGRASRGRSGVVIEYDAGILCVEPNPSGALCKISEIHDRIAFAAVGRYNEFENLRKAAVRYAYTSGYQYDRSGVTARAWPTGTRRSSGRSSPGATSCTRRGLWSPTWARAPPPTRCTGSPSTAGSLPSTALSPWAAGQSGVRRAQGTLHRGHALSGALATAAVAAQGNGETSEVNAGQLELAVPWLPWRPVT